jgi:hypothetical protein
MRPLLVRNEDLAAWVGYFKPRIAGGLAAASPAKTACSGPVARIPASERPGLASEGGLLAPNCNISYTRSPFFNIGNSPWP